MGIRSHITDSKNKLTADVVKKETCGCQALAVATVPYREFENELKFFIDDEGSADMNINASSSGTPLKVYNADDTLWTFSDIVGGGKTTPVNAEHPHTGTNALKVDNSPVDDVYQFDNGSALNMTDYQSVTLWIYIDKDYKARDSISLYGWDTATGLQVGTDIFLEDYLDIGTTKSYQKILIPLTDFGALSASTTLDAFRVRQVSKEGKAPKYFLDDMQLEAAPADPIPVKYTIQADKGTWLLIDEFKFSFADEVDGTLEDGTMPKLSYDKILGATLTVGLNYQREEGKELIFTAVIKDLMDLLEIAGTEMVSVGDDGTNVFMTVRAKHNEPLVLKSEDEDELSFTVNDDLSGLKHLRISAAGRLERRENL